MLRIREYSELSQAEREGLLMRLSAREQADAREVVTEIIDRVEREGVPAVLEYTRRFDGVELKTLTATEDEFAAAEGQLDQKLKDAFREAAENITAFHKLQREALADREAEIRGARLGFKYVPVEGAGVYVPGGTAVLASSVLMGLIPASAAGVDSPLLITPPNKDGSVHPAVLFCARLAGCGAVLKVGGAQGVAAAAFGLAGPRVRLIIGPGNRFVTAAKSILAGRNVIRMDMPAGPSEVLVIADDSANPVYIAADMLSQAEHGADSPALLVTASRKLAEATAREIERALESRPKRREMKTAAIRDHGWALIVKNMDEALAFANDYAAEHLEIQTENPAADFERIRNAGSVFLGHYAPVALGDYYSGTNHVLPTGGAAKYYSGLGVDAFLKRITYQHPTRESLRTALGPILEMSRMEGLDEEHGNSVAVRFQES